MAKLCRYIIILIIIIVTGKSIASTYFVCYFNSLMYDFADDVPPPGAYDPKFDVKVKGSVIEKSDRFLDSKSTGSAECSTSIASVKSNATTPLFRMVIVANFIINFNI